MSKEHMIHVNQLKTMKISILRISRIMVTTILVAVSGTASAQWHIGANGGYTYNTLTTSSSYQYDRNYSGVGGFTVNATAGYQFTDWLSVNADLGYIEKSYKFQRTVLPEPYVNENATITNGYVQLPIYAGFSFGGKRLRGFVNLGAYSNYWASSHTEGVTMRVISPDDNYVHEFDESVAFDSRRDNRFECGLMAGIGMQFAASNLITVFAEGRYYHSLTDMQKKYMEKQVARYNNTMSIMIGIKFNISQAKSKHQ